MQRTGENGISNFVNLCELPYESFIKVMAPDRFTPSYNDNYELDVKSTVAAGYCAVSAAAGFCMDRNRRQPGNGSGIYLIFLPYAGYVAMRSGWDRSANYLGFDIGPTGKGHVHSDKLNVVLWSYGRRMLFDSERVNYDDTPMSNYLADTFSHNTVIIDGRPQRAAMGTPGVSQMPYKPLTDVVGNGSGP